MRVGKWPLAPTSFVENCCWTWNIANSNLLTQIPFRGTIYNAECHGIWTGPHSRYDHLKVARQITEIEVLRRDEISHECVGGRFCKGGMPFERYNIRFRWENCFIDHTASSSSPIFRQRIFAISRVFFTGMTIVFEETKRIVLLTVPNSIRKQEVDMRWLSQSISSHRCCAFGLRRIVVRSGVVRSFVNNSCFVIGRCGWLYKKQTKESKIVPTKTNTSRRLVANLLRETHIGADNSTFLANLTLLLCLPEWWLVVGRCFDSGKKALQGRGVIVMWIRIFASKRGVSAEFSVESHVLHTVP